MRRESRRNRDGAKEFVTLSFELRLFVLSSSSHIADEQAAENRYSNTNRDSGAQAPFWMTQQYRSQIVPEREIDKQSKPEAEDSVAPQELASAQVSIPAVKSPGSRRPSELPLRDRSWGPIVTPCKAGVQGFEGTSGSSLAKEAAGGNSHAG